MLEGRQDKEELSDPLNISIHPGKPLLGRFKNVKMYSTNSSKAKTFKIERYKKQADRMNLTYSKVICPLNMRSKYWKFFGFPADDKNRVVSKEQIVCNLCNIPINFHKNTTNLRSHLQRHHKEVSFSDCEEKSPKKKYKSDTSNKDKFIIKELRAKSDSNPLMETITTESDLFESGQVTADSIEYQDCETNIEQEIDVGNFPDNQFYKKSEINLIESIQEMIISDLQSTSIIEGTGFQNFLWTLCQNATIPTKKEIEESLNSLYEKNKIKLFRILQNHSLSHPFSLGIELWQNIEKKNLATIYFNYIPSMEQTTIRNVLYTTVELSKYVNFEEVFQGVNMKNCSAAVTNSYNTNVQVFLSSYGIPTINCFDMVIQKCMKLVFDLPEVSSMFKEIQDLFNKHSDILSEAVHFNQIYDSYPWTKYNLLKVFHDNITFQDEDNELYYKIKSVLNCLQTFEITMETLTDEPNALSSLMKPLVSRLLTQHFQPKHDDYGLTIQIKEIITEELKDSVLSNNFLILSSFLDPRFHSFVHEDEMKTIHDSLKRRATNLKCHASSTKSNNENEELHHSEETNSKRSILKLFFDDQRKTISPNISLETEVIKYRAEVCADLDECPFNWWLKMEYVFQQLKQIADTCICVPCCINNSFKKTVEEQVDFNNRRLMLKGVSIHAVLFLHYNKNILNNLGI